MESINAITHTDPAYLMLSENFHIGSDLKMLSSKTAHMKFLIAFSDIEYVSKDSIVESSPLNFSDSSAALCRWWLNIIM